MNDKAKNEAFFPSGSVSRFGEFLVNKGIVDEEAIWDALNYQRKQTIPIGKIALKEKKLTMKQILQILSAQTDTIKRFGEIAVEFGYLTEDDVSNLLEIQRKQRTPIGEILVELKKISKETLDRELTRYFSYLEEAKKSGILKK